MQSLALGLARFMALRADPLQEKLLTLWREWDEIFGPMAEDIVPLGHRESTLLLGAFSSIAMQEYRYVADQILEPVNRFLEEPVFNTIRLELVGTRTPLNRLDACRQAVSFSRPVPEQIGQLDLPPDTPVGRAYARYLEYVKKQQYKC